MTNTKKMEIPWYVTVKEAAALLKKSEFKIRRMIKAGQVRPRKIGNSRDELNMAELLEAIERTATEKEVAGQEVTEVTESDSEDRE